MGELVALSILTVSLGAVLILLLAAARHGHSKHPRVAVRRY